jgi:hypothetical protein
MSKFIEHLEKVGVAVPAAMGFGASRVPEKVPSLLLVALSGTTPADSLAQLPVDFHIISTAKVSKSELKAARGVAGDALWGVWPETLTSSSLDTLSKEGGDFFIFSNVTTPAEVLVGEELGKLMAVPADLSEEMVRSLEELPVDAILLSGLEETSPLSVGDLMQVRWVRDWMSKPLLLLRSQSLSQGELEVLQDAGIQAVVLDMRTMNGKDVDAMREAIEGLPPRKARRDHATALLPRLSPRTAPPPSAGEEDEDEDDDY